MLLHSRLIVANHATHFNPAENASFLRPLTSPPCTAMTAGAGHSAAGMPIIAITPSVRPSAIRVRICLQITRRRTYCP